MSIGSISPSTSYNCIKNVTFRNIKMTKPLKGIYIKTNPGDTGAGIVSNINYINFTMDTPIWWAIYIGPQQMK
jgi:polygalacturonase